LIDTYDEQQRRLLEKFAEYLRRKEVITIRLKAGESVFIDNNRILHGRGPIQEDSQRLIKRVWIKADN
jgi:alpha-ketoglutarate-dependent taurine dioxygenase